MLILSQNKRLTTESLALSIEDIDNKKEKKIMVQENCGKLYLLGKYKTEERAKEVLQEIIETYKENGIVKIDNAQVENKAVYEMPLE